MKDKFDDDDDKMVEVKDGEESPKVACETDRTSSKITAKTSRDIYKMYGNYMESRKFFTVQEVAELPPRQTEQEAAFKRSHAKVLYASDMRLVLIYRLLLLLFVCISCRFGGSIFPLIR